ncbi:transposase [mine drainage metagenome]|uniref:Transposase n=1 Tax=mine drainage metagenome TaxID=410659 RepID=A0A1J5QM52_9ZZZZ
MPANILNLPAYTVTAIDQNDNDYHIDAVVKEPPRNCPHCRSDNLVGFGRREQMVRDLPTHGRRVGLYVDTRRFQCRSCTKTFYESLPDLDERRPMTQRLVKWVGKQSIKRTFASIGEEVGIDEKSVRSIFRDYINELEKTVRFETPQWMGIDEIHLIRPRGVIANIQNNTIVELLPNRNKETVARYLHQLDGKDCIQYVAMDMWAPYRDACIAVIPQAQIVIDKFHVVRMANDAMERARKSLRERLTLKERRGLMHDRFVLLKRERDLNDKERLLLSGWVRNYPELGEAHRLKEDFFTIYETQSKDEAQGRYIGWKRGMSAESAAAFSDLVRAWDNWAPWILGYFDHPITNAYTESLNNLIRVMNRLGRGYSFEALRAKILFSEGAHKIVKPKPKFERRAPDNDRHLASYSLCSFPSTQKEEPEKNYGADISTLVRMIEAGEL